MEKASNENTRRKVFQQVQRCLMSLVGGSGHLAGYSIFLDTFEITEVEELNKESKKYYFSAEAYLESEFTVYDEHHQPGAECISGSIVFDKDLKLVRDDKGRVMLEPWICIDTPEPD